MKYRLGIDLGTSSIGVAAYELNNNNEIKDLVYLDSYIFGEPVNPKMLVTLNTDRRSARLIRRQIERKAKRLRKLAYIAQSIGVTKEKLDAIKDDDVIALRAKAPIEKIKLPELIKVFSHIAKNRGYKGDLRTEGDISSKIDETKEMLGDKTLGQLLYDKRESSADNAPWRKLNKDGTFITRDIIVDEFERIWKEQVNHHEELKDSYPITYKEMFPDHIGKDEIPLKDAFFSAMFYQRPIKWKPETVGFCSLEEDEYRAAASQPAFQKYRLIANIVNLRIKTSGKKDERALTQSEIKKVYDYVCQHYEKYNSRAKIQYNLIYDELGLAGSDKFTIDRAKGDAAKEAGLKGITTLQSFYNCDKEDFKFINAFNSLSEKAQELTMEFLANITKYADIQENEEGYIDTKFDTSKADALIKNVKGATADDNKNAKEFIKMLRKEEIFYNDKFELEQGRTSYSVKALNKIIPELLKGENEQNVIAKLYPPRSESQENAVLRDYEKIATNNPVIDKVLREFKRTMDFIVKNFGGNPAEMTIELTRELKNSLAKRSYIEKQNSIAQADRTNAINELKGNGIVLTGENIEKYLLCQDQDGFCPYCGEKISIGHLINNTQIDHIIPQAIGGPNIYANKILAHTKCNHEKGNKIPYEYKFSKDIEEYIEFLSEKKKAKKSGGENIREFGNQSPLINYVKSLWQKYMKESKGYYDKRKRKWTATQKGKRFLDKINFILTKSDEIKSIIGDFSNLHLNSTAWINKIIMDWSKDICPKVTPSFGALTAYLRDKWHYNEILPLVRIKEGKNLYGKDEKDKDRVIDTDKWKELFIARDLKFSESKALAEEFKEYLNSLPGDEKPANDSDKQKEFENFCQNLRQENKFNKRCDYRHHAVDAAVIGLSTLSLIQQASQHNARHGGLYGVKDNKGEVVIPHFEIRKEDALLYKRIKEKAEKYLTNFVVWHKPDHFPNGKFFDDTAYGVVEKDKEKIFTIRKSLEDIFIKKKQPKEEFREFKELKAKIEEVVVGNMIKEEIISQLEKRSKAMPLKEAFLGNDEKGYLNFRGNRVRKLKVMYKEKHLMKYDNNIDIAIPTPPNKAGEARYKYYQNAGYACMEFDAITKKIKDTITLSKWKDDKQNDQNIIRIFINDILFDKKTEDFFVVKSFSKRDGLKCILHSESLIKDTKKENKTEKQEIKNKKTFSNLKDVILCKTRADIARIKKEYGK